MQKGNFINEYKRTKYERETLVLTSEADSTYTVYTFNTSLKTRLAQFAEKYPKHCKLISDTGDGGMTYEVEKGRLSIRLVPPYSEERKMAARARATMNLKSKINISK